MSQSNIIRQANRFLKGRPTPPNLDAMVQVQAIRERNEAMVRVVALAIETGTVSAEGIRRIRDALAFLDTEPEGESIDIESSASPCVTSSDLITQANPERQGAHDGD